MKAGEILANNKIIVADKSLSQCKFRFILKNLRQEHRLSQTELAEKLQIAPSTVAMWESGRNIPGVDTLLILSKIFNVSIDYLLGITNDTETIKVPVYVQPVNLSKIHSNINEIDYREYVPHKYGAKYVALQLRNVKNGSFLCDKDIVLIRITEKVKDGDYIAVTYPNNETLIKKIHIYPNGYVFTDESGLEKPDYFEFLDIKEKKIEIIGVVEEIHKVFSC